MARILLIDDDASLREVVSFTLQEAGHEVLTAVDGESGLKLFAGELPDLVLSDIIMGEHDGFELCRQLRSDSATASLPVILLSALGTQEQRLKAIAVGAVDYLLKPIDLDELVARVQAVLRWAAVDRNEPLV